MGVRKARCPSCKKLRRYETLPTDRQASPPVCRFCKGLPPSLEARFLREYGSWLLCNEDGRAYEVVRVDDASVYDHGVPIADVRAYVGPGREIRKPVYLNSDGTIRDSAVWCKLAAVGR